MSDTQQEVHSDEALFDVLRSRDIIGIAAIADGSDDMGFVSRAYLVTSEGICQEGMAVYKKSPASGIYKGTVMTNRGKQGILEAVLSMSQHAFLEKYPSYGTGTNCSDTFVIAIPSPGEPCQVRLGNGDMGEDVEELLNISAPAPRF